MPLSRPTATGRNAEAEPHPFSIHDMLAMKRISDPQASPDGEWIVFVLTSFDVEENKSTADLWLVDADGARARRLTSHPAKDGNPRWAPDGKTIWFIRSASDGNPPAKAGGSLVNREGDSTLSQVWRIPIDGGEAEQVTDEPLDVGNLVVSPDGSRIAFTMEVFLDCETPKDTQKRLDEIKKRKASGRIYDRLLIRHWDTWKDGRRSHLFVKPAHGGKAVDIMKDMDADVPSKPFGGTEEFTFTPDGQSIVFAARDVGREEAWSTAFNLYVAPVNASAKPKRLTTSKAWDTQPTFSPDGKTLAYLAMARPGFEADRFRIVLRPWPHGAEAPPPTEPPTLAKEPPTLVGGHTTEERVLTEHWDRSAATIVWAPDGRTIYTTAANIGQQSLFAVDVATGEVRTVVEPGHVAAPVIAGDRIVYGLNHLCSPVELHSVKPDGSDARAVTRVNAEKVATARTGEPEQFSFAGWNDETVYAYVVKPVAFDPAKRYPVAFLIHGGPQGSFGNVFHYRWNPQVYAGAGYAVVMVDFHGSTGYGQAFTDSIRDDWGGKPLVDLQKGLAAALERCPWMDGDRVAALGASYGGYMINWIAGNWPGRFRCLVNHDGNLDERMAYYDTEELWFPEWERRGTPWENPQAYTRHNPIDFVKNWKTPMLVIHGGNDFRVVDSQGISTFTALQRRGIPSKFLFFPDENHWVVKPANSVLWHETVIGWLDEWTKGKQRGANS
ncbi:MAG: S9 family peptidase [Phycisphaerae bacterium]|nr:S9 family peptidase [Phycisphaerae bacterium]